ncbi:MAG: hypothetical protein AAFX56_11395 [Pseudomonadota bacterium]
MKLRIRDNSIRLRLTRQEVDSLNRQGLVSASTAFPGGRRLHYEIESSPASVTPAAYFSENRLTVRLPETTVLAWASTEQVSMSGEQRLDDGELLTLLVEKDFRCLAPRDSEDESDMYPNPLEQKPKIA